MDILKLCISSTKYSVHRVLKSKLTKLDTLDLTRLLRQFSAAESETSADYPKERAVREATEKKTVSGIRVRATDDLAFDRKANARTLGEKKRIARKRKPTKVCQNAETQKGNGRARETQAENG